MSSAFPPYFYMTVLKLKLYSGVCLVWVFVYQQLQYNCELHLSSELKMNLRNLYTSPLRSDHSEGNFQHMKNIRQSAQEFHVICNKSSGNTKIRL